MSVELRIINHGADKCHCGVPYPSDCPSVPGCRHYIECDWGVIYNSEADPHKGLEHLILTTESYVENLLASGPRPSSRGGTHSASRDGDRVFVHLDYDGRRTTWEVFPAYFDDGGGPHDIVVGRWPD